MQNGGNGFGSLQFLMGMAAMGLASMLAVPQYEAYANHGRIADALEYAGGSVQDISHYFIENGQFPKFQAEIASISKEQIQPPPFVKNMTIIPDEDGETVSIRVNMRVGVFENEMGEPQYVWLKAQKSPLNEYEIHWSCGTSGINLTYLPEYCFK